MLSPPGDVNPVHLPTPCTVWVSQVGATYLGLAIHLFLVLPALFAAFTRGRNPYTYLANTAPALLTALGSSSSAAALPLTLSCATERNGVAPSVANFVCSLGATINMDGTAIGYPCSVLFVALVQVGCMHAALYIT